jgi:hypothetical protein
MAQPDPDLLHPYGRNLHRRRDEVEYPFRKPAGFRRILAGFEKLDTMPAAVVHAGPIIDMARAGTP